MAILTFNIVDVKKLVEEITSASAFLPTIEQLWLPELHKGGVLLDDKGRTEKEAKAEKDFFWPSAKNVERAKIEPRLTLVGDHGVYLITNADLPGSPISRGTVAYAKGCNPSVDEDFYENKQRRFGSNDGTVSFPVSWAEMAIMANKKVFKLKLLKTSISYVP